MSKYNRDRRMNKVARQRRHYDAEMIHDFLAQLRCHLMATIADLQGKPESLKPEVANQLKHFAAKHDAVLITATTYDKVTAKPENVLAFEMEVVPEIVKERTEQLEHLEELGPLFAEAMLCLTAPISSGMMPQRKYDLSGAKPTTEQPGRNGGNPGSCSSDRNDTAH